MASNFGGLSDKYRYFEFELDSLDDSQAANNSASATDWPLFKIGGKKPLENIAAIKILECQIPFTWYVINTSNNTFLYQDAFVGPLTVVLPIGNFTVTQMLNNLQNAINPYNAGSNPGGLVGQTLYTYTVTYDSTQQKFTYWNNNGSNTPFSFTFGTVNDEGNTNPRLILGFPDGTTTSGGYAASGTPKGNFLTSPNAMSITGPNYLYLNSQRIGNLTDLYLPRGAVNLGGGNAGPQMAKIPVNVQPGGVIFWVDPAPMMWFDLENLQSLTEIDFFLSLGNTSGQYPLQLNGQPFSLKIGLLVNDFTSNNYSSGGNVNDRVRTRIARR